MSFPKHDWTRHESYDSEYGTVYRNAATGEWVAKVIMPSGQYGRLKETYVSAEAARGAVERTWKREHSIAKGLVEGNRRFENGHGRSV